MYSKNNSGASTIPWGTPDRTYTEQSAQPQEKTTVIRASRCDCSIRES